MRARAAVRAVVNAFVVTLAWQGAARADSGGLSLPVDKHTLANGLRVILAPDEALPDVSVVVRYDTGSADDPDGLEGLAHLVEHVAFAGSRDVGPDEHALARAGGCNRCPGTYRPRFDRLHGTVPLEGLERALWLEANRMGFLRDFVQSSVVERERTIVGHEYRLSVIDSVLGSLGVFAWNELYPAWHPYRFASDGLSAIDHADAGDVRAFVRVVRARQRDPRARGSFDPASVMGLVEKHFGPLPGRASAGRSFRQSLRPATCGSGSMPPARPNTRQCRGSRRRSASLPTAHSTSLPAFSRVRMAG